MLRDRLEVCPGENPVRETYRLFSADPEESRGHGSGNHKSTTAGIAIGAVEGSGQDAPSASIHGEDEQRRYGKGYRPDSPGNLGS